MRSDRTLGILFVLPAAAFFVPLVLWPVLGTVELGFHRSIVGLPGVGEPFVGLENYRDLAASPTFRRSFVTTITFVLATTALELVLGTALALVLDARFRGRGWVRAAALVPWAVPTIVAAQMWRFLLNDRHGPIGAGLLGGVAVLAEPGGALGAVIVADVWKTTPFVALVVLAGLQAIPDEVHEAAAVDGAGSVRRFLTVTLPLLRPALLVALLFRTIDAFRVFDLVFVLTGGGPGDATNVLSYFAYKTMFAEGRMGLGAAAATVVFAATLLVSIAWVRAVGSSLWEARS